MATEDMLCKAVLLWLEEEEATSRICAELFKRVNLADVSLGCLENHVECHTVTNHTAAIRSLVEEEIRRRHPSRNRQAVVEEEEEDGSNSEESVTETNPSEAVSTHETGRPLTVTSLLSPPADYLLLRSKTSHDDYVTVLSNEAKEWLTKKRPVSSHGSCAVLHGDSLMVTGGKKTHFFDLDNHDWSPGPELRHERWYHGMAVVRGNVYVVAGLHERKSSTSIEECSQDSEWEEIGNLQHPTRWCGVTALGDTILVVGGATKAKAKLIQTFNVRTKTSALVETMIEPIYHVKAASLGTTAFFVGKEGDLIQVRKVDGTFKISWVELEDFGKKESFGVQVTDTRVRVTDCEENALRTAVWNFEGKKVKEEESIARLSKKADVFAVFKADNHGN